MSSSKVLHEWHRPKELKIKLSDVLPLLKLFLRAYFVSVIIAVPLYFYLKSIIASEFNKVLNDFFMKFILISFAFITLPVLLIFISWMLHVVTRWKFYFPKYQISEKGICLCGIHGWYCGWLGIQGFWIEFSERYKNISFIVLWSGKRRQFVPLPQDKELSERILKTISQKIPQISLLDKPPRHILSNMQMVFMSIFTIVYSYILAYICSPYFCRGSKGEYSWILLIFILSVFIIGPGTVSLAMLTKGTWNEFKKYDSYAFSFNLLGFILLFFFLLTMEIRYFLNQAGM